MKSPTKSKLQLHLAFLERLEKIIQDIKGESREEKFAKKVFLRLYRKGAVDLDDYDLEDEEIE
ncbi:hypothetical protein [Raineya orbicola]|jgi:hypothetical protein|uniref:Uncharacterized protein n=1 Tax=Raineya orbicola TaxID=2016530 RepID=A0A2N3I9R7_9BACT|nr:hypothetical protein [Raineya orbicola]PKQ67071.1 hypothetical protein Rain11_2176 [Raineya orbicola]